MEEPHETVEQEVRRTGLFTLTEDHLRLLHRTCVSWNLTETGAPTIDPKRPYGNSAVESDIAAIIDPFYRDLGDYGDYDDRERYTEAHSDRLMRLHGETAVALQIVLCTGAFKPGLYELENRYDDRSWRRVTLTVDKGLWYPEMPPMLVGEDIGHYTDRLLGAHGEDQRPYSHPRNRQCSIGWHDECSDPTGEVCECPHHIDPFYSSREVPQ
jgi:hypothetical protein